MAAPEYLTAQEVPPASVRRGKTVAPGFDGAAGRGAGQTERVDPDQGSD
jgi:hypothetical protein